MDILTFRSSFLLKDFKIWVFVKCAFFILWMISSQARGTADTVFLDILSGFFGFVTVWFFGAVASSFPLISVTAVAVYIFVLVALTSKSIELKQKVPKALWFVFALSMFTLWAEPFIAMVIPGGLLGDALGVWIGSRFGIFFMIFDPFVSAAWFFMTVAINRKISREILHPESSAQVSSNDTTQMSVVNPTLSLLLSLIGGGYFYLGQVGKGIILLLLLTTASEPAILLPLYLLSIVDTHRLTRKCNQLGKIRKWSVCWNPYMFGNIFFAGILLSSIFPPY